MNASEIQLDVFVSVSGADAERLDGLAVRLMRDLRELGAEPVRRPFGEETSRGAQSIPLPVGAPALLAVQAFLPELAEFLQAWSLQGERQRIKIKTLGGLGRPNREQLCPVWWIGTVTKTGRIQTRRVYPPLDGILEPSNRSASRSDT